MCDSKLAQRYSLIARIRFWFVEEVRFLAVYAEEESSPGLERENSSIAIEGLPPGRMLREEHRTASWGENKIAEVRVA